MLLLPCLGLSGLRLSRLWLPGLLLLSSLLLVGLLLLLSGRLIRRRLFWRVLGRVFECLALFADIVDRLLLLFCRFLQRLGQLLVAADLFFPRRKTGYRALRDPAEAPCSASGFGFGAALACAARCASRSAAQCRLMPGSTAAGVWPTAWFDSAAIAFCRLVPRQAFAEPVPRLPGFWRGPWPLRRLPLAIRLHFRCWPICFVGVFGRLTNASLAAGESAPVNCWACCLAHQPAFVRPGPGFPEARWASLVSLLASCLALSNARAASARWVAAAGLPSSVCFAA